MMSAPKKKTARRRIQYAALPFRRRANSRTQIMLVYVARDWTLDHSKRLAEEAKNALRLSCTRGP